MTMNTMELDGYTAVIRYTPETDEFCGEVQGLNGGADFYGRTPNELRREFRVSLDFFLETCAKHGIAPKNRPAANSWYVSLLPCMPRLRQPPRPPASALTPWLKKQFAMSFTPVNCLNDYRKH
jgi:hypothetical protein